MSVTPLDFDPFEGDFGCPGDRTLTDAMVRARKVHICSHCKGPIGVGETYRSRADIADGELMRWGWCTLCCDAMVRQMRGSDDEGTEATYPYDDRAATQSTGSRTP